MVLFVYHNLQVFSFGSNGNGQTGVAGVDVVKEPTEIYTGTGIIS